MNRRSARPARRHRIDCVQHPAHGAPGEEIAGASAGGQTGGEDNVIDAEYVDVDENK